MQPWSGMLQLPTRETQINFNAAMIDFLTDFQGKIGPGSYCKIKV